MSNTTTYLVDFPTAYTVYDVPFKLWQLYTEHLWNYQPASWVGKAAYTSRLLAFALLFPFVVLTGLDVASYLIARTLGVIDDVKASTTDKATRLDVPLPVIHVHDASPRMAHLADTGSAQSSPGQNPPSNDTSLSDTNSLMGNMHLNNELPSLDVSDPHAYFASEENSLKLSGVGVFSPAASLPPSPTLTRRHLSPDGRMPLLGMSSIKGTVGGGKEMPEGELEEGLTFRTRAHRVDNDD